jgi:hypothetical protein
MVITMTEQFFIKNLWRDLVGLPEEEWKLDTKKIYQTEWSNEFEQLMKNRLIQGALRYGRINKPGKLCFDHIGSIYSRISIYRITGNKEMLVDVANLCLLEFVEGKHPNSHFHPTDDGQHVTI